MLKFTDWLIYLIISLFMLGGIGLVLFIYCIIYLIIERR